MLYKKVNHTAAQARFNDNYIAWIKNTSGPMDKMLAMVRALGYEFAIISDSLEILNENLSDVSSEIGKLPSVLQAAEDVSVAIVASGKLVAEMIKNTSPIKG